MNPPPEKKQKTSSGRPTNTASFVEYKDIALCKAYVNVSQDPVRGSEKKAAVFWEDIKQRYDEVLKMEVNSSKKLPDRNKESLKNRYKKIQLTTGHLNSCLANSKRSPPNGIPNSNGRRVD
jgi:hypothetical protein